MWQRFQRFLRSVLTGKSAPAQSSQSADAGFIGTKLSALETNHDFFRFFNLARIGSEDLPDRQTLISFKPTGEAFHALVTLFVTIDGRGIIEGLRLEVARSFIDNPRQGIFAADLVKSYLQGADGVSASSDIAALADEISARTMTRSAAPVLSARPMPVLPGQPSASYRTYAGEGSAQTLFSRSDSIQVTLQNQNQVAAPMFEVIVSAKPCS
jgi:hypothetical protein